MKTFSIQFALFILFSCHHNLYANQFAFCEHLDSVTGGMYRDDSKKTVNLQDEVTSILVRKDIRRLYLLHDHEIIKGYNIALGKSPLGHKERRGDHKTPEGIYKISLKNAKSGYHKALKISYPNEQDIARAHKKDLNPGGDVFLHGLSNDPTRKRELMAGEHPVINWTWGCIAVNDAEIDEIFRVVPVNTPIEICPKEKPMTSPTKIL